MVKVRKKLKPIVKTVLISSIILLIIIVYISFSSLKRTAEKKELDRISNELNDIAKKSTLAKDYIKYDPRYRKLSQQEINSSISAGFISPDISSEIYVVDYVEPDLKVGISLTIDLENKEILRTQQIVAIGV